MLELTEDGSEALAAVTQVPLALRQSTGWAVISRLPQAPRENTPQVRGGLGVGRGGGRGSRGREAGGHGSVPHPRSMASWCRVWPVAVAQSALCEGTSTLSSSPHTAPPPAGLTGHLLRRPSHGTLSGSPYMAPPPVALTGHPIQQPSWHPAQRPSPGTLSGGPYTAPPPVGPVQGYRASGSHSGSMVPRLHASPMK